MFTPPVSINIRIFVSELPSLKGTICRTSAPFTMNVGSEDVIRYLGNPPIMDEDSDLRNHPGLATGMAWTELGGTRPPRRGQPPQRGRQTHSHGKTGRRHEVRAPRSPSAYVRANSERFGIDPEFHKENDIHIHVPEGAIPKDGPSAGITLTAALLSALKKTSLIPAVAMTGEITLTDRLLPIGGVKEKVLAAHRNKCRTILLPEKNRKDQEDLPEEIRDDLRFIFTSSVRGSAGAVIPGRDLSRECVGALISSPEEKLNCHKRFFLL